MHSPGSVCVTGLPLATNLIQLFMHYQYMWLQHVTSCGNELGCEGYQVAQEWLCMEGWWYWQWHYVINCTWQFREVDWTFNYLLLNKRGDQLLQLHLDMEGGKGGRGGERKRKGRNQDTISLQIDEKSMISLKYPIRIINKVWSIMIPVCYYYASIILNIMLSLHVGTIIEQALIAICMCMRVKQLVLFIYLSDLSAIVATKIT